ncbi:glycosyltransferase family 4 protein [Gammaproteobacteria bacterium]|nr:glycosyltransferase family 4 protein [Gammaproteobacteria bacterium]
MHILFITDNFPPESNAPANRTFEHAREWVKKGHKVTVVTCAPNFPDGKLQKGYKNNLISKETIEDINVWRVKTYITPNEGFFKRSLDYVSFMFSSSIFGLFTKNVDIIIGTSPQFFTVISSWFLSKVKRVPFVFELRDIWPASITAVGAMKQNFVIKLFEKIELFLYDEAKLIISVTESFKDDLEKRGVKRGKIKVIHNGVDLKRFNKKLNQDNTYIEKFNLEDKFIVGYIGTLGLAHSIENILLAAERTLENKNIKFVLVGNGAERNKLKKIIEKRKLTNVLMIPNQPREKITKLWSICDVSIVNLKNTPLFRTVIPSKIFESMGSGLPIIICVPKGEATKIIESTNSGIAIEPENPKLLSDSILSIYNDKDLYDQLASNSAIASKHYDRKTLALKMLQHLEDLLD